jgi:hypothetical protein
VPPSFFPSRPRTLLAWLVLSGLGPSVLGCSTTDAATAVAPAGPPVLGIQAVHPAGGSETSPEDAKSCVALGVDANKTLTVVLVGDPAHKGPPPALALGTIKNWTLEPPFACIGTPQCGYVLVTVDPGQPSGFTVASVAVSIDIPLVRLRDPTGDHTLVVELRNSDGTRAEDDKGKPYQVTLPIHVSPSCGETPLDAGADGSRPTSDGGLRDAATLPARDGSSVQDGAAPVDARSPADARSPLPPDAGAAPVDSGPSDSGPRDQ